MWILKRFWAELLKNLRDFPGGFAGELPGICRGFAGDFPFTGRGLVILFSEEGIAGDFPGICRGFPCKILGKSLGKSPGSPWNLLKVGSSSFIFPFLDGFLPTFIPLRNSVFFASFLLQMTEESSQYVFIRNAIKNLFCSDVNTFSWKGWQAEDYQPFFLYPARFSDPYHRRDFP